MLPAAAVCQEEDPAAGKSFFMTHLSKVICKLQKEASVKAVLLILVVERLCVSSGLFLCFVVPRHNMNPGWAVGKPVCSVPFKLSHELWH